MRSRNNSGQSSNGTSSPLNFSTDTVISQILTNATPLQRLRERSNNRVSESRLKSSGSSMKRTLSNISPFASPISNYQISIDFPLFDGLDSNILNESKDLHPQHKQVDQNSNNSPQEFITQEKVYTTNATTKCSTSQGVLDELWSSSQGQQPQHQQQNKGYLQKEQNTMGKVIEENHPNRWDYYSTPPPRMLRDCQEESEKGKFEGERVRHENTVMKDVLFNGYSQKDLLSTIGKQQRTKLTTTIPEDEDKLELADQKMLRGVLKDVLEELNHEKEERIEMESLLKEITKAMKMTTKENNFLKETIKQLKKMQEESEKKAEQMAQYNERQKQVIQEQEDYFKRKYQGQLLTHMQKLSEENQQLRNTIQQEIKKRAKSSSQHGRVRVTVSQQHPQLQWPWISQEGQGGQLQKQVQPHQVQSQYNHQNRCNSSYYPC